MPRSSKPRRKQRHHKIDVPVMRELHESFAMTLHVGAMMLEHAANAEAFDGIGRCLNVIGLALMQKEELSNEYMPALNSGCLALNQIEERANRIGKWHANEYELPSIKHAATVADMLVPKFTVVELYAAMKKLDSIKTNMEV
jgi:hypothetical protein